jgi:hypothetical protein
MRIKHVIPEENGLLRIVSEDGRTGLFNVRPYMESDAFRALKEPEAFKQVLNGGYFVEWRCGADLSADTIEAHWQQICNDDVRAVAESPAAYGSPSKN